MLIYDRNIYYTHKIGAVIVQSDKLSSFFKIPLTNPLDSAIMMKLTADSENLAGVAQLVEQLICNQQVGGSSPSTSLNMGEFPSGQRGQTVNLLRNASVVQIHPLPCERQSFDFGRLSFFYLDICIVSQKASE